jgi:hypothetical protein
LSIAAAVDVLQMKNINFFQNKFAKLLTWFTITSLESIPFSNASNSTQSTRSVWK